MVAVPALKLVRESKICDLMPGAQPTKRWEASGVMVKDRHFFVVFDDRTEIARLSVDLQPNHTNGLFGTALSEMWLRRHRLQRRQATVLSVGRIAQTTPE